MGSKQWADDSTDSIRPSISPFTSPEVGEEQEKLPPDVADNSDAAVTGHPCQKAPENMHPAPLMKNLSCQHTNQGTVPDITQTSVVPADLAIADQPAAFHAGGSTSAIVPLAARRAAVRHRAESYSSPKTTMMPMANLTSRYSSEDSFDFFVDDDDEHVPSPAWASAPDAPLRRARSAQQKAPSQPTLRKPKLQAAAKSVDAPTPSQRVVQQRPAVPGVETQAAVTAAAAAGAPRDVPTPQPRLPSKRVKTPAHRLPTASTRVKTPANRLPSASKRVEAPLSPPAPAHSTGQPRAGSDTPGGRSHSSAAKQGHHTPGAQSAPPATHPTQIRRVELGPLKRARSVRVSAAVRAIEHGGTPGRPSPSSTGKREQQSCAAATSPPAVAQAAAGTPKSGDIAQVDSCANVKSDGAGLATIAAANAFIVDANVYDAVETAAAAAAAAAGVPAAVYDAVEDGEAAEETAAAAAAAAGVPAAVDDAVEDGKAAEDTAAPAAAAAVYDVVENEDVHEDREQSQGLEARIGFVAAAGSQGISTKPTDTVCGEKGADTAPPPMSDVPLEETACGQLAGVASTAPYPVLPPSTQGPVRRKASFLEAGQAFTGPGRGQTSVMTAHCGPRRRKRVPHV